MSLQALHEPISLYMTPLERERERIPTFKSPRNRNHGGHMVISRTVMSRGRPGNRARNDIRQSNPFRRLHTGS